MRCPKCGYISFDHLNECLKCRKNIQEKTETLRGSVLNIAPPAFLSLQPESQEEPTEDIEIYADDPELTEEYVDEDLEVLVESSDSEIESGIDTSDMELDDVAPPEPTLDFSDDADEVEEVEGEIEIDLSQFEDAPTLDEPLLDDTDEVVELVDEASAEPALSIKVPEELSDISDLAPPSDKTVEEIAVSEEAGDGDFPDMELDELNFDLGLDDLGDDLASASGAGEEDMLVLDDIDFSETVTESSSDEPTEPSGEPGILNMDDDLNFDLDLGGLSIHKDV